MQGSFSGGSTIHAEVYRAQVVSQVPLARDYENDDNIGMRTKGGLLRGTILISAGLLIASFPAFGEHRMISVGDRRLSIDCDGEAGAATVILIAGGGRLAQDWVKVQPAVAKFARVCSYDRAGFGESDKAASSKLQLVDEVVEDLHRLLREAGERGPFILVAHSIAGIYARSYATEYANELAGLVFVDSSHEEQMLRLHAIDPAGPGLDALTEQLGYFVKPGERLDWQTKLPLIVLGHGKPYPRTARDGSDSSSNRMTEEQWAAWDQSWRDLQEDLAKRSKLGEFRLAPQSGHFIQLDQPELVIQAIRDLSK